MTAKEFILSLPERVHPEAISGEQTLFHFELDGEHGGHFTVHINDGKVLVEEGLAGDPHCRVSAPGEQFMQVVNGSLNPLMAIMTGKVKISDQGLMLKYARVFGLMK